MPVTRLARWLTGVGVVCGLLGAVQVAGMGSSEDTARGLRNGLAAQLAELSATATQWTTYGGGAAGLALVRPSGLAAHPSGLLIADSGNDRIVLVDSSGALAQVWGGSGTAAGEFLEPADVAVLESGLMVVADTDNDRVQIIGGAAAVVVGDRGTGDGEFVRPMAVLGLVGGGFLVADEGNDRIQEFDTAGVFLRAISGVHAPNGLAFDATGAVWVSERLGHQLRRVVLAGPGSLHETHGGLGAEIDDMTTPADVAVGDDGTLFVADAGNGRVVQIGLSSTTLFRFLLDFERPSAVLALGTKLYVADAGADRVYAFDEGIAPPPDAVLEPGDPTQTCADGYFLGEQDGDVHTFGSAVAAPGAAPTADMIDIQSSVTGCGYWRVFTNGAVDPAGDAPDLGAFALGTLAADEQLTSVSATLSGQGLWGFTSSGRVLVLGDAAPIANGAGNTDLLHLQLQGGIVDSVVTPDGLGLYMLGADGGVFTFGTANYSGSVPGLELGRRWRRGSVLVRRSVPRVVSGARWRHAQRSDGWDGRLRRRVSPGGRRWRSLQLQRSSILGIARRGPT